MEPPAWSRFVGAHGHGGFGPWLLAAAEPTRPVNLHDRARKANRSMAGPTQFSTDRFALQLGLFYAAYFFFGGVQLPFFPLWLEARGLDARTIGMVIAVPTVVRIVVTPIITHQADRRRALKATLVLASVAATLGMTRARAGVRAGRDPVDVSPSRRWRCRRCCRCPTPMRCQRAWRARPRLWPGAAVGLGRLHRRQCRRGLCCWSGSRPAI